MKKYLVFKDNYNGTVISSNINGCSFNPRNSINYGIKVNEVIIVKQSLIEKVVKRKIKSKLDFYLQFLIEQLDNDDSDSSRKALGDLQRYRLIVNEKYANYLDSKYIELLNKKFDVIEKELKSNIIYDELEEVHKSR